MDDCVMINYCHHYVIEDEDGAQYELGIAYYENGSSEVYD